MSRASREKPKLHMRIFILHAYGFPCSDRGHHVPALTGWRDVGFDISSSVKNFSLTRTALFLEALTPLFPVTESVDASGYVNVPLLDPPFVFFLVPFFSGRGSGFQLVVVALGLGLVASGVCVRRLWFGFLLVGSNSVREEGHRPNNRQ